jgi:hypothetical protein
MVVCSVLKCGFQGALTSSGLLMRQQFFLPLKFHKDMAERCQMVLAAPSLTRGADNLGFWLNPFSFTIERDACFVAFRMTS